MFSFFLALFYKHMVKFKRLLFIVENFTTLPFSQNPILIFCSIVRIQRVVKPSPGLRHMYSIHVCVTLWSHLGSCSCSMHSDTHVMSCLSNCFTMSQNQKFFSSPILPAGPSQLRKNEAVGHQFRHHHQQ